MKHLTIKNREINPKEPLNKQIQILKRKIKQISIIGTRQELTKLLSGCFLRQYVPDYPIHLSIVANYNPILSRNITIYRNLFFYSQGRQRIRTTIFDTIQLHIKNQCGIP